MNDTASQPAAGNLPAAPAEAGHVTLLQHNYLESGAAEPAGEREGEEK